MAVGQSRLLFRLKKVQKMSAVLLENGVSLVRREVVGMWYVKVSCNSDLLVKTATVFLGQKCQITG